MTRDCSKPSSEDLSFSLSLSPLLERKVPWKSIDHQRIGVQQSWVNGPEWSAIIWKVNARVSRVPCSQGLPITQATVRVSKITRKDIVARGTWTGDARESLINENVEWVASNWLIQLRAHQWFDWRNDRKDNKSSLAKLVGHRPIVSSC